MTEQRPGIWHERGGDSHQLASEVEVATSLLDRAAGLMFRRSFPDGRALVFPFNAPGERWVHMVAVPFDIDVLWVVGSVVKHRERLSAWTGNATARGQVVIELPAGVADGIGPGDRVVWNSPDG